LLRKNKRGNPNFVWSGTSKRIISKIENRFWKRLLGNKSQILSPILSCVPDNDKGHAVRDGFRVIDQKSHALRDELSWTHYRLLMKVENLKARDYYIKETVSQNWSIRALERQINSFYYERIVSSKNKTKVSEEAEKETNKLQLAPEDFIKDPYVLEFLNIRSDSGFIEKDIEKAIIQKLRQFMLEMGKGFSFVAQQKRISAEDDHFYVDLVFYNYILKCFVLIDLKLGKLNHQDIGQMDLYVRWFEDKVRSTTDNPTIGIILCAEKNETIVKYSILKESKHLFASKYKLYLPSIEELKRELDTEIIHQTQPRFTACRLIIPKC